MVDKFEISEAPFTGTSNIAAIIKVLKALNWRIHRQDWEHEANAASEDDVQVGTIRLPTRSWTLYVCAVFSLTHYIWVKHDGSRLVFVGPKSLRKRFVQVSNKSANRQPTEEEIQELQLSMASNNPLDRMCVYVERVLFLWLFLVVLVLVLRRISSPSVR